MRVAVALGPDGKVRGASPWMRPLLDPHAHFIAANLGKGLDSMGQAALLYEVGVLKRGDSA